MKWVLPSKALIIINCEQVFQYREEIQFAFIRKHTTLPFIVREDKIMLVGVQKKISNN